MIIQRLTPLVNNLMHETLFTKSMLQKENKSLSTLFLGQAKIQLLSEFKKQHKLYPTQKSNGIIHESIANIIFLQLPIKNNTK